jgi:hypothetical protein
MLPPGPVSTPPVEVAMRKPCSVVANSLTDCFSLEITVPGNRRIATGCVLLLDVRMGSCPGCNHEETANASARGGPLG